MGGGGGGGGEGQEGVEVHHLLPLSFVYLFVEFMITMYRIKKIVFVLFKPRRKHRSERKHGNSVSAPRTEKVDMSL